MTKKEKREQKIRDNPNNVSLEDFESLINQYGCIKEGGKHPQALIGHRVFSYKRKNPVRPHFVKNILELIDNIVK